MTFIETTAINRRLIVTCTKIERFITFICSLHFYVKNATFSFSKNIYTDRSCINAGINSKFRLMDNNIVNLDIKEFFEKRGANGRFAHHLAKHEIIGDGVFYTVLAFHGNSSVHGACSATETVKAIADAT